MANKLPNEDPLRDDLLATARLRLNEYFAPSMSRLPRIQDRLLFVAILSSSMALSLVIPMMNGWPSWAAMVLVPFLFTASYFVTFQAVVPWLLGRMADVPNREAIDPQRRGTS